MQGDELYLSGDAGLTFRVAGAAIVSAYPRARVHLGAETAPDRVGEGLAIAVSVSSAHLRTILGHVPLGDTLEAGSAKPGGLEVSVRDAVLVRRIAEELREAPYTEGALRLFLQGKVIELLVAGLWASGRQAAASVAEVARDRLLADPLNPPTVADLALALGLSPRTLSGRFKAFFGMTVPEWLTEWRLVRAKELVVDGATPLAEIAASLGYAHLSNFSSAFSKRFGVPPGRLRSSTRRLEQTAIPPTASATPSWPPPARPASLHPKSGCRISS
ncbi:MAG: AraC family transcriptional regulator [Rhodospirillaceae bacterium]